jgi:uncharacterized protein (DUF952 family)
MNQTRPQYVFHIAERSAFAAALEVGKYETDSLASEGFIHCSNREQILRTAARFYGGRKGLVLLCIGTEPLADVLRYEVADGEAFPHCYGAIPLEAIPAVIDFPCRADGTFELPDELALFQANPSP